MTSHTCHILDVEQVACSGSKYNCDSAMEACGKLTSRVHAIVSNSQLYIIETISQYKRQYVLRYQGKNADVTYMGLDSKM